MSEGVEAVLDSGAVSTVFQPVIDLDSVQVVGYEALTRGPAGPFESPDALFAAARAVGRLTELDWLCRTAAIDAARDAGVRFPLSVLVNAEPETLLADHRDPSRWGQFADLRCYCELTERALVGNPGRLAAAVDQIRAQDWGIALDDVGVDAASLALLPLLQPDIVKLDASLLRPPRTAAGVDVGEVVHAVLAQAERTGAAVIAEGIETSDDLSLARAYGVAYGQGFLLGRPGPLPQMLPTPSSTMNLVPRILDRAVDPGPFAVFADRRRPRRLRLDAIVELIRQVLSEAQHLRPGPAVLVTSPTQLPQAVADALAQLDTGPDRVPLLGIVGHPQLGLPTTRLRRRDPARDDLAVVVVSPHFAAAVAARPDLNGADVYDAGLTLDPATAAAVANSILTRLVTDD